MKFRKLFALALLFSCAANFAFAISNSKASKILDLIENGSAKKIKKFLTQNRGLADEKFGPNKNSLLIEALDKGRDYDVIKLLLDAGASPKAQNVDGDSAVTYAAKKGAGKKVLKALITYDTVLPFQRKNRILRKNAEGKSALDYAKESGNQEQLETINRYLGVVDVAAPAPQEKKPEPASEQKTQETPKPAEPEKPAQTEPSVVPAEPEANEVPAVPAAAAMTAPVDALALQEAAKAAANRAASPYKRVYLFEGIEAFDTENAKEEAERALIAEPNKADSEGRTLLHKAASLDDIDMIFLLRDSGADFNLADKDGYTPLMYAARFAKRIETVAILLSKGADAKAKNRYGLTAIEIAAADNKNPEIVSALLAKSKKADAQKAFVAAVGLGRPNSIIKKFFEGGMSANDIYKGKSVLMYACESNTHTNCIKFLLDNGADKKMLSNDWKDAFWFASQNPNLPKNDVYWSLNNSAPEKKK